MKPEYDEAAEILNKGADVSFVTFAHVYSEQHACLPACELCSFFIFHTLINIQSCMGAAVPH